MLHLCIANSKMNKFSLTPLCFITFLLNFNCLWLCLKSKISLLLYNYYNWMALTLTMSEYKNFGNYFLLTVMLQKLAVMTFLFLDRTFSPSEFLWTSCKPLLWVDVLGYRLAGQNTLPLSPKTYTPLLVNY